MNRATRIENWIKNHLSPTHCQVVNESHSHNVPAGSETHFKLVIVSDHFEGKNLVERHRLVYSGLEEELKKEASTEEASALKSGGHHANGAALHALSLQLFTPTEWAKKMGIAAESPACRGGDGSLPKRHS